MKSGFFGNHEAPSKTAFSILLSKIDTCQHDTVKNWKVGIENGKYGPTGEDLVAEICRRKNGVTMLEAFDMAKDGMCEAKRPGSMKQNKLTCFSQQLESVYAWKISMEARLLQHVNSSKVPRLMQEIAEDHPAKSDVQYTDMEIVKGL